MAEIMYLPLFFTFNVIKVKIYLPPYFIENRGVCLIWQFCITLERFFFLQHQAEITIRAECGGIA